MKYKIYNHNDTFLGEFETFEKAQKEARFYREQTGNCAWIDYPEEIELEEKQDANIQSNFCKLLHRDC